MAAEAFSEREYHGSCWGEQLNVCLGPCMGITILQAPHARSRLGGGPARRSPPAVRTEEEPVPEPYELFKDTDTDRDWRWFFITGCNRYADGPAFSLRSGEERIASNRRVESAKEGSNDVTSFFTQYELRLTTGGDASLQADHELGSLTFSFQTNGRSAFENDDEDLRLDYANDAADEMYRILRLKENELWLRENGDDLELHLVPN